MKALKLSSHPDDKKQLKAQCGVLMDVADRIKKSSDWTPLVRQSATNSDAQIGQWAANVDVSGSPGPAYAEAASLESSSVYSFPQAALPVNARSTSGNSPFSSVSFPSQNPFDADLYRDERRQASMLLIDLSEDLPHSPRGNTSSADADTLRKDRNPILDGENMFFPSTPMTSGIPSQYSKSSSQVTVTGPDYMTPIAPKLASPSHIHRLKEPVSTRRRSKKEDIILLKASVVNGFKCPPWNGNPAPTDFTPQNGQELFM